METYYELEEGILNQLFLEEVNEEENQKTEQQQEPNQNQEQKPKLHWWEKIGEKAAIGAAAIGLGTQPVLGAVGFSSIGPVAGSIAAGIQASIGSVGAGSAFAACQSIAMGGLGAVALPALAVGGVTVFAGIQIKQLGDRRKWW